MLNNTVIKKTFLDLIGFADDMSNHTQYLQASLRKSLSGVYFQDAHPLITLQILEEIAPRVLTLDKFPEVVPGNYKEGDIVKNNNVLYVALKDTVYADTFLSTDWEETSVFSIWLSSKVKSTITKVIQTVLARSAINAEGKNILSSGPLFTGAGYINDVIANNNNLVGLVIEQKVTNGISLKINRIGFQSTIPGEIPLYIYHSSNINPIKIVPLVKTKENTFEWIITDDLVLSLYEFDVNGYWLFAYNQTDLDSLNSLAIKNVANLTRNCPTCNHSQVLSQFIDTIAFSAANTDFNDTLWDQNNNIYYTDTNFGLNLDISIVCDFTEIFTRHKNDFINLIKLQFANDMLREYIYNANARVNRTAAIASRADVIYALDGDMSKFSRKSGLAYDLEREYEVFAINTKGFNNRCLPCKQSGIRYKTVL